MQTAALYSSVGLFILLLISGVIAVADTLPTASVPTVLTGFTTYGSLLIAVMTLGVIGFSLIKVFGDSLSAKS